MIRPRQLSMISEEDVKLINSKIKLLSRLKAQGIDYDEYRCNVSCKNFQDITAYQLGIFVQINPTDFASFTLQTLTESLESRFGESPKVPKYYRPKSKEQESFVTFVTRLRRELANSTESRSKMPDSFFSMDYHTLFRNSESLILPIEQADNGPHAVVPVSPRVG